ncbi:MAG: hypothetical protein ACKO0Z_22415 [Betaproteobacteria bacterium]
MTDYATQDRQRFIQQESLSGVTLTDFLASQELRRMLPNKVQAHFWTQHLEETKHPLYQQIKRKDELQ